MSNKNKQKQVLVAAPVTSVPQETTKAETLEEFASEICLAFEKEVELTKIRSTGQSLPMNEIIGALDMIFDTAQADRAPVKMMAPKVAKLLKFKYEKMSATATHEVAVRINPKTIQMVQEKDLRALRLNQLKHMQESKTDNLYRRIYNIGSRAEYGRFEATSSMIIRVKKLGEEEPTS
jgi:hypothetical protein